MILRMRFKADDSDFGFPGTVDPEKAAGSRRSVFEVGLPDLARLAQELAVTLSEWIDIVRLKAIMAGVCGKEKDGLGKFLEKTGFGLAEGAFAGTGAEIVPENLHFRDTHADGKAHRLLVKLGKFAKLVRIDRRAGNALGEILHGAVEHAECLL